MAASSCRFTVDGMTCGACVGTVERAVLTLDIVASASVSLMTNSAEVTLVPGVDAAGAAARIVETIEDVGFDAAHLETRAPKPTVCTFSVDGMTCGACVGTVERAILALEGVAAATVSLLTSSAEVTLRPAAAADAPAMARSAATTARRRRARATHIRRRSHRRGRGGNSGYFRKGLSKY